MLIDPKTVLVVHAVDTEGPLYESLEATFNRLESLYGITGLPKTQETLDKLKAGEIDLGGKEDVVRQTLSGHLLNYNRNWAEIDAMLDSVMAEDSRMRMPDSYGGGWTFNWHCVDHVDYVDNPRRRTIGYHAIFDHYAEAMRLRHAGKDALHFHFHPMSTYRHAHLCATSYLNSPHLSQVISRRIIERGWFPSCFRAGFQAERPDSHWFLEQWIPFDYSNMAIDDPTEFDHSIDFKNGRSGDWRRAPADWSVYHPSHDDYQVPGNCRRSIARALNVLNRIASLDQREVDKAFARAQGGEPTILGFATHDFRDLGVKVDFVRGLLADSATRFPNVKFKYCEGVEAFRHALGYDEDRIVPLELEVDLDTAPADDVPNLTIRTTQGDVFGPQPWLAIETRGRRFIHDNLDLGAERGTWHYAFHADTLPLSDVKNIGVGAADKYGNTCVKVVPVGGA